MKVKAVFRAIIMLEGFHPAKPVIIGRFLEAGTSLSAARAHAASSARTKTTAARAPVFLPRAGATLAVLTGESRAADGHERQRGLRSIAWLQDLNVHLLQVCLLA